MAETKPTLNYRVAKVPNPADRTQFIFTPIVTDRDRSITLAQVVAEAIDRGLVLGMKAEAAEGVAKGILTQLGKELNNGKNVVFGDYFRTQVNFTGTVDGLLDTVDSDNELKVSLIPGKDYKLFRDNFECRNVNITGEIPEIESVQGDDDAEDGVIDPSNPVQILGRHLKLDFDRGDYAVLWNAVAEGTGWKRGTVKARFETPSYIKSNTDKLLRVDMSGAWGSTPPTRSERYYVQVVKHQIVNGESASVETKLVLCTFAAA